MTSKFERKKTATGKFVMPSKSNNRIKATPNITNTKAAGNATKSSLPRKEPKSQVTTSGYKYFGAFADDPGALDLFDDIERERDKRRIGE